jgi:hypothetical protein
MTTSLVTTGRKRSRDSNRSDSSNIIVNPLDVVEGGDLIADRLEVAPTSLHARASIRERRGFYQYGGHVGALVQGAVAKAPTRGPGAQADL